MITVRLDSSVPLADQILSGIRSLIARAELKPGDELPPVRQLAGDLGINLNTVARAYRALEADGLVVTSRGRGTRVTSDIERPDATRAETRARLQSTLASALADLKLAGLSRDDAVRLLNDSLKRYWPLKGETT